MSDVTDSVFVSAAPVSVPDAPPPGHEHRERASEGEQAAQEAPETDSKVKRGQAYHAVSLPLVVWGVPLK